VISDSQYHPETLADCFANLKMAEGGEKQLRRNYRRSEAQAHVDDFEVAVDSLQEFNRLIGVKDSYHRSERFVKDRCYEHSRSA
jgi:hypothetical protein